MKGRGCVQFWYGTCNFQWLKLYMMAIIKLVELLSSITHWILITSVFNWIARFLWYGLYKIQVPTWIEYVRVSIPCPHSDLNSPMGNKYASDLISCKQENRKIIVLLFQSECGGLNEPGLSKMYKFALAPIEDSDQPAHPRSLIWVLDRRSMGSQGSNVSSGIKLRICSDCAHAQTNLNLRFMHMPTCILHWVPT